MADSPAVGVTVDQHAEAPDRAGRFEAGLRPTFRIRSDDARHGLIVAVTGLRGLWLAGVPSRVRRRLDGDGERGGRHVEGEERHGPFGRRLPPSRIHENAPDDQTGGGHDDRRGPEPCSAGDVQQVEHRHEHHQADAAKEAQRRERVGRPRAIGPIRVQALPIPLLELDEVVEHGGGIRRAAQRGQSVQSRVLPCSLIELPERRLQEPSPSLGAQEEIQGHGGLAAFGEKELRVAEILLAGQFRGEQEMRGHCGRAVLGEARYRLGDQPDSQSGL